MIATFQFEGKAYTVNLKSPISIGIPLKNGSNNPNCYFAEPVKFETIRSGDFIGSVKEGGSVNYQKLITTPHGNGTHTECLGHITNTNHTISNSIKDFHFFAELVTVAPQKRGSDYIITLADVRKLKNHKTEAFIIRTSPNDRSKTIRQYSNTNPPYFEAELLEWLSEDGVVHFLTDLPSVDKEFDGGRLEAHKAFWGINKPLIRHYATITELIYVDDNIKDGVYLLNLGLPNIDMDAVPGNPVLYKLNENHKL